jgi:hypothetical protein
MNFKERYQAVESEIDRERDEANSTLVNANQWLLEVLEETKEVGCRVEPAPAIRRDGTWSVYMAGWTHCPLCSLSIEVGNCGTKHPDYYVYFVKGIHSTKKNLVGHSEYGLPLLREQIHLQLIDWILEIKDKRRGVTC